MSQLDMGLALPQRDSGPFLQEPALLRSPDLGAQCSRSCGRVPALTASQQTGSAGVRACVRGLSHAPLPVSVPVCIREKHHFSQRTLQFQSDVTGFVLISLSVFLTSFLSGRSLALIVLNTRTHCSVPRVSQSPRTPAAPCPRPSLPIRALLPRPRLSSGPGADILLACRGFIPGAGLHLVWRPCIPLSDLGDLCQSAPPLGFPPVPTWPFPFSC